MIFEQNSGNNEILDDQETCSEVSVRKEQEYNNNMNKREHISMEHYVSDKDILQDVLHNFMDYLYDKEDFNDGVTEDNFLKKTYSFIRNDNVPSYTFLGNQNQSKRSDDKDNTKYDSLHHLTIDNIVEEEFPYFKKYNMNIPSISNFPYNYVEVSQPKCNFADIPPIKTFVEYVEEEELQKIKNAESKNDVNNINDIISIKLYPGESETTKNAVQLRKNIDIIRISKLKNHIKNTKELLQQNIKNVDKNNIQKDYLKSKSDESNLDEGFDVQLSAKLNYSSSGNRKIAENLNLISNNLHEMLTESIKGIDSICHKVKEYVGDFQRGNVSAITTSKNKEPENTVSPQIKSKTSSKRYDINPPTTIMEEDEEKYKNTDDSRSVQKVNITLKCIEPAQGNPNIKDIVNKKERTSKEHKSPNHTTISLPDWPNEDRPKSNSNLKVPFSDRPKSNSNLKVPRKRIKQRKILERFRDFLRKDVDVCFEKLPLLINNLNQRINKLSYESKKDFLSEVKSNQDIHGELPVVKQQQRIESVDGKPNLQYKNYFSKSSHIPRKVKSKYNDRHVKEALDTIFQLSMFNIRRPHKKNDSSNVVLNARTKSYPNKIAIIRTNKTDPSILQLDMKNFSKLELDLTKKSSFYSKESRIIDLQKTYGQPQQNICKNSKKIKLQKPVKNVNGTRISLNGVEKNNRTKVVIGGNINVKKQRPKSGKASSTRLNNCRYCNKNKIPVKQINVKHCQKRVAVDLVKEKLLKKSKSSEHISKETTQKAQRKKLTNLKKSSAYTQI